MSEDRPLITVVATAPADLAGSGGDFVEWAGGGPFDVAIGLGRLGARVGLLTSLGDDAYGAAFAARLAADGVQSLGPAATAPVAEIRVEGSVRSYAFALAVDPRDADPWHVPAETACLHTEVIPTTRGSGADAVRRVVEQWRGRVTVSYAPGCRQSPTGDPARLRARVEQLVGLSDVVKAAEADLRWLYPELDHIEVADAWLARGPALVVVTRGGQGAYGLCRSGAVTCPAAPVDVVDVVGAGDAFTAGLLRGLAGRDLLGAKAAERLRAVSTVVLGELLDEAAVAAAVTCGRAGA
ncbi:PfkB family carbohydrate kinase, partial [Streptomyces sp. SID3343]|uniref:PfkB family carbohydrate kinase n=1 Tax=Streptomyces sp. SID3343 TaxID=2690260 RepID=UPI00136D9B21